jgi:predicted DsbA family dithiol-disulfide isomerase
MKKKTNTKLNIEVWSDFVCPFCYIGEKQLEQALKNFAHRDEVNIQMRAYELDENAPCTWGDSVLGEKGSADYAENVRFWDKIQNLATTVNLHYDVEHLCHVNTYDAHRIGVLADIDGLRGKFSEKVFNAFFVQARNIADKSVLKELAVASGVAGEAVDKLLSSDLYGNDVREEEQKAEDLKVEIIPTIIINGKHRIGGVLHVADIVALLEKAYADEAPDDEIISGPACGIHGCK